MESKRIGVIGHFGGNEIFTDGQTVKTKEVTSQIEANYNITTIKFDTYKNNSHNPIKLVLGINKVLRKSDYVFVILSERGYKIINLIISFLNCFYRRKLYDVVIGGTRYKLYDKSRFQKKLASKYKAIFVETQFMKDEYAKRGLENVIVFPNFKSIKKQLYFDPNNQKLKLCTFTRIRKEKGIEDAIKAVIQANEELGKNLIELDLYGRPDGDYQEKFDELIKELPPYIQYKGLVNPNESTEVLKNYDLMLFLTFWHSEGFPGTIVDAFFSGLPVIATDWNYNFTILKENYTGFKVKINDIDEVVKLLLHFSKIKNRDELLAMRKNCLKEADNYVPENVMKKLYKEID